MIHFRNTGSDVSWQPCATMTVIRTAIIMWHSKLKHYVYYRASSNICLQPLILPSGSAEHFNHLWDFDCKSFSVFYKKKRSEPQWGSVRIKGQDTRTFNIFQTSLRSAKDSRSCGMDKVNQDLLSLQSTGWTDITWLWSRSQSVALKLYCMCQTYGCLRIRHLAPSCGVWITQSSTQQCV